MNNYQRLTNIFTVLSTLFFLNLIGVEAQSIYTLPIGTKIRVQMDNEINSKVSGVNDTFTATVSNAVIVREIEMIPKGSIIEGKILEVKAASAGKTNGFLNLRFDTLLFPEGEKRQIEAVLVNTDLTGKKSSSFTALSIFGGTAIGAIFGAITGKSKGAVIGAGVGAGAGTVISLAQKGNEARIKANEEFEIRLNKEVTVPVKDF